jgi:hypothetical protein
MAVHRSRPPSSSITGFVLQVYLVPRSERPPSAKTLIPPSYMGHLVSNIWNSISLTDIATIPLSEIAGNLRNALNQMNVYSIRSFLTFINRHEDKGPINYGSGLNLASNELSARPNPFLDCHQITSSFLLPSLPHWVRATTRLPLVL